jgi:hypothetical protein
MDKAIARLNIEHYRKLLANEMKHGDKQLRACLPRKRQNWPR